MWLQMEGICWELWTGPDKSCGADEGTLSCSMLLPHTVGLLGGETAHEALRCWGPKSQGLSQLAHFCTSKFQGEMARFSAAFPMPSLGHLFHHFAWKLNGLCSVLTALFHQRNYAIFLWIFTPGSLHMLAKRTPGTSSKIIAYSFIYLRSSFCFKFSWFE